jgi:hypothetical protein
MSVRQVFQAVLFGLCVLLVVPLTGLSWLEKRALRGEAI